MSHRVTALILLYGISTLVAESPSAVQIITLKDSSIIYGKIIEDTGRAYVIQSQSVGRISIKTRDIHSVRQSAPEASILPVVPTGQAVQSRSVASATTGDWMTSLASKFKGLISPDKDSLSKLAQRQDVKNVLSDPRLVRAIQAGDLATLKEDPLVKQMLSNPQTKSMVKNFLNVSPGSK